MFLEIVQKHAKQNTPNFSPADIFKIVQNEKAGRVSCKKNACDHRGKATFQEKSVWLHTFFQK